MQGTVYDGRVFRPDCVIVRHLVHGVGGSAGPGKGVFDGMQFHSHIGQDRWVAETLNYRRDAFFLEFGAFDGISSSNTLMLERDLGWSGIVVEPNPTYYPSVCKHRSCITVNAALWPSSRQSVEMVDAHGLSCVREYINVDHNQHTREQIALRNFNMDTINPTELLRRYNAPDRIEYLSLDVEGCELDVLQAIDFSFYQIAMITVEHSEVPERQKAIRSFLSPLGYKVIARHYDDWFFHPVYIQQIQLPGELFNPLAAFHTVRQDHVVT